MNKLSLTRTFQTTSVLLVFLCASCPLRAAEVFQQRVAPFTKKYCIRCHNSKKARGELDLTQYTQASDVIAHFRRWNSVIEFIRDGKMPPEKAQQPTIPERTAVIETLEKILLTEAKKHAGDPGGILPRRLSNTEYDLCIRDLTGVDIRPTRTFPPDPAGGEGFTNTGEALTMSPSLFKKYLAAAQEVSSHLVLKTSGITFAPFPVTSYNERKKLTEQAIIDFYHNHEVRIRDYLEAAWRYRYRRKDERDTTIENWAKRQELSPRYLALVWQTLSEASSGTGYLKQLGQLWNAIPRPTSAENVPGELLKLDRFIDFCRRNLCHHEERLIRSNAGNWPISHLAFRAQTAALRDRVDPGAFKSQHVIQFQRIRVPRRKDRKVNNLLLSIRIDQAFDSDKESYVLLRRPLFSKSNKYPRNKRDETRHQVVTLRAFLERHSPALAKRLSFGKHPRGHRIDPDSIAVQAPALIEIPVPSELFRDLDGKQLLVECQLDPERSKEGAVRVRHANGKVSNDAYHADVALLVHGDSKLAKELSTSAQRICGTFPNRFFYVDNRRGLAAGFHLVEGFFRDDQPLVEKVLDEQQLQELNGLWEELHFVTNSTETLIRGFVWFERSERHVLHDKRFDFLRPEDPRLVEDKMLTRFEKVYLGKMGVKLVEGTLKPESPSDRFDMIHGFFEQVRTGLTRRRVLMKTAEQKALQDIEILARRAYRRSLQPREVKSLHTLYQKLRKQGQGVEDSLRGVFMAILMSPDFSYRFTHVPEGPGVHPLSNQDLASRLSFFLWSSLPDEALLTTAEQGKLLKDEVLVDHTRRMLKDPKISTFAREFFGQWLRYRDYLVKDPINAATFPGYNDRLRQAMFAEPVHLATYLIQQDKPITELLHSDTTFVNGVLARHYGGSLLDQYRSEVAKWTQKQKKRGLPSSVQPEEVWHKVEGLRSMGRGGLFGMGVILTKNSAGERTSPVKRGFWTAHHLLGQHFPPPPADVPELPANEKKARKTIRELLAEHASNPSCAMCHKHFDGLGLAMEGFDPIGRARTRDLAGRTINDVAVLPNGKTAKGIPGLIEYVEKHRHQDFVRTLCRKFLGYALGRSVMLSDQPLLKEMETALERNDYRFSVLFETVVRSPQFRQRRGRTRTGS